MSAKALRQRGVTLFELILFIVVIGVGVAGLASVIGNARQRSDPMVRKQMVTVAESMMLEVLRQPFTFCDPDDAAAATVALNTAGCTGGAANSQDRNGVAALGPTPAGEVRFNGAQLFDNVADYAGYAQTPVTDMLGNNPLPGYQVAVAVARAGAAFGMQPGDALQVTVTVTGPVPAEPQIVLNSYRFRYAPRF